MRIKVHGVRKPNKGSVYDFEEEYRSDGERHVAPQLQSDRSRSTPLRQKQPAASITTYLRLRRGETQIFHKTLSTKPIPFLRSSLQHVQKRKFPCPTMY
ncbi:hypothetical protein TNCV_2421151 [Trichonephila clavipes]|uniref:Uncharacterized protein n=1 Tax=Trichonephila clavipes TaxID=2585209 RepID=A0A8X6R833_TRICX|nr:hypothetical protein TNCV_2421151 [Trichonephila clavipes]